MLDYNVHEVVTDNFGKFCAKLREMRQSGNWSGYKARNGLYTFYQGLSVLKIHHIPFAGAVNER